MKTSSSPSVAAQPTTQKADPSTDSRALRRAAELAQEFYAGLNDRHIGVTVPYRDLLQRFRAELDGAGVDPVQVVEDLARDVEGGLLGSGSGRFFGWVIGGTVPAALATDWLVSAWDQVGAIYATSPASAVIEEVAADWLKDVLGLPAECSCAMVTGCQMAHFTALAAARTRLLADRGHDVERSGLAGTPQIRVLTGSHRHESLLRAVKFLGIGLDAVQLIDLKDGRMDMEHLENVLAEDDAPAIVSLMAGDLNTGRCDPFTEACQLAHSRGAWVHVDGAFGLWVNASERHRHLLEGCELADSWATDGHKWLNVPYDIGYAFVRDADAHRRAMTMRASYFIDADGAGRDPMDWNPEWSRRPRGIVTYAAMRSLGRDGIADIVDTCCRLADRLVSEIGALEGAEVVAPAGMNQGLVRFLDLAGGSDGDHDTRTDQVIDALQAEGTSWFGGATWLGQRVMRISVSNYRTSDEDVDKTVAVIRGVLAAQV